MNDTQEFEKNLDDIESLIKQMKEEFQEIDSRPAKEEKIPSNLEVIISGISSNSDLSNLFSGGLDDLMSKMLKLIEDGEFNKIINSEGSINNVINSLGLDSNKMFSGKISGSILNTIQKTANSEKYKKIKDGVFKLGITKRYNIVMKELKKNKNQFKTKEEREKYMNAVYAIKYVLSIMLDVYRKRRKVLTGLSALVTESYVPGMKTPVINLLEEVNDEN